MSGQTDYELPADGGTISVSFSSSEEWTAYASEPWVTISPIRGDAGNNTISITANPNTNIEKSRSADIEIRISDKSEHLTIYQGESKGYFIDQKEYEIGKAGGTLRIPVKANISDYSCTVDKGCESWISIVNTKALDTYYIQLEVLENTHGEVREGSITVSYKSHEETIKIKQAEGDELIVTTKTFEIGSVGGEIKVPVSTNKDIKISVISGSGWIKAESIQTKTVQDYYIVMSVSPNTTYDERIGQVKIQSGTNKGSYFDLDGNESIVTITQSQKDELIITTTSYEIGSNGGTISIPVKSNTDYSYEVLGGCTWLSVSSANTKSLETSYVSVSIEKNASYDARTGQIKFTGAGKESIITITQKQLDELVVGQTSYEIGSSGGAIEVIVSSNVEYSAEAIGNAKEWITIKSVSTKALEETTTILEINKNEDYEARVGQVKFSGAGKESIITITQDKYNELLINQTQYYVDSYGGEITIELKTNTEYTYSISEDAQTWISRTTGTKSSLSSESLSFTIKKNDTGKDREGIITISIAAKDITITVFQDGIIEVYNSTKGGLLNVLSGYELDNIVSLKITGVLNDIDFLVLNTRLKNLKNLDISEVDITSLPPKTFINNETIERVYLPKTLTIIGKSIFENSKIKSMIIPASVKEIEQRAFAACSELESITFEEKSSLEIIDGGYDDDHLGAFYNCLKLSEIIIPSSVKQIEAGAFACCKLLSRVVFSKGIGLTCISGPNTIEDKAYGVFYKCESLKSIVIPASVETIGMAAFLQSGIETVTFESGSKLKTICGGRDYGAFQYSSLKTIIIPKSVETIEDNAFYGSSLEEVTFEKGSALKKIGGSFYQGVGMGAFQSTSIKSIIIPPGVTRIEPSTFKRCKNLERVSFENGSQLKSIEGSIFKSWLGVTVHGAFMDCDKLVSIDIPSSVEEIGIAAFSGCKSLKNITFGKNSALKSIKGGYTYYTNSDREYYFCYYGAFNNCTSLVSLTIPANVESIGDAAFRNCSSLETVVFEQGSKISSIGGGKEEFSGQSPGGYYKKYEVYYGAFSGATSLWFVDMSAAVNMKSINDYAFHDCPIQIVKIATPTPPSCGANSFAAKIDNSILKVPTASIDNYKTATGWKDFTSISGLDD